MTASRTSAAGLVLRHLAAGRTVSVLVSLLVAVSVGVVVAAPRALAELGTAELRHELRSQSPLLLDLDGRGRIGDRSMSAPLPDFAALSEGIDRRIRALPSTIPMPLRAATGTPHWFVRTPADAATVADPSVPSASIRLVVDLDWRDRVTFTEGAEPGIWDGDETARAADNPPIEVAISGTAAGLLEVGVGDLIDYRPAALRVAGIYEPTDPDDPYWQHAGDLAAAILERDSGTQPVVRGSVYLAPESLVPLRSAAAGGDLAAWVPIDPDAFSYRDAAVLQQQVQTLTTTRVPLPDQGVLDIRSSLVTSIDRVVATMTATSALLAFELSGLVLVLIAVLALGVQAVLARRRPSLVLAAARGTGRAQLRTIAAVEGLVIAVPGWLLGVAAAQALLPGPSPLGDLLLPIAIGLAPPIMFATLVDPSPARDERDDLGVRGRGRSRGLAEVGVVLLAIASVAVLARRGIVSADAGVGIDPLVVSAPALIAVAVCVGVLRLYPLPLRAVRALIGRTGAAAATVGAARAIRAPALGFIAALALVVGISVVAFATVMASTIPAALGRAALERVGADIRVQAHDLPDALVDELARIDGVEAVVAVTVVPGVALEDSGGPRDVTVVVADAASLAAVRPDLPPLAGGTAVGEPILASADRIARIEPDGLRLGGREVTLVGAIPSRSFPGIFRNWVLLDAASPIADGFAGAVPQQLLISVADGADPAALAGRIDDLVTGEQPEPFRGTVVVIDTASEFEQAHTSPAVASLEVGLLIAAAATLLMTMVTVVLASAAAARTRRHLVGVLRILGMSRRQLTTILAWELGPVAVMAVLVGTGLGLAMPFLLLRLLDLRPFVGGSELPTPIVEPLPVLVGVGAFVLATVVAGGVSIVLARRSAPAGTLKMGEG